MPTDDWRSADAYAYANRLGAADLAWEFLRRNHDYQNEFSAMNSAAPHVEKEAARRWGLRFPG